MEENKEHEKKTGFTVSELEGTAKKYASEIGLGVIFAMTAIFTLIWGGSMMVWSIILSMILAIVGALVPGSMMAGISKALDYVYRERVMLIITGVVLLIIAIFIPVLIFAFVGLIAGGSLSLSMKKKACKTCCTSDKEHTNKDKDTKD